MKFREGRTGRNPRTGALVSVGSKAVPLFRSGKGMKSLLTSHAQRLSSMKVSSAMYVRTATFLPSGESTGTISS